jgi:hypothetical protein
LPAIWRHVDHAVRAGGACARVCSSMGCALVSGEGHHLISRAGKAHLLETRQPRRRTVEIAATAGIVAGRAATACL